MLEVVAKITEGEQSPMPVTDHLDVNDEIDNIVADWMRHKGFIAPSWIQKKLRVNSLVNSDDTTAIKLLVWCKLFDAKIAMIDLLLHGTVLKIVYVSQSTCWKGYKSMHILDGCSNATMLTVKHNHKHHKINLTQYRHFLSSSSMRNKPKIPNYKLTQTLHLPHSLTYGTAMFPQWHHLPRNFLYLRRNGC